MRIQGHYIVSLNGFRCNNSTWDDALNRDGFADEVFFHNETRYLDGTGNLTDDGVVRRESKTLGSEGDGRYVFGSGRNIFGLHRGIASGDEFPGAQPWIRRDPVPNPDDVPTLVLWEGDLVSDWEGDHTDYWGGRRVTHEGFAFITPTIWERDPGEDAMLGWLDWLVQAEERFGEKAREAVTGVWPQAAPVFGLVSLGVRILGTIDQVTGRAGTKPVGTQRNPETGELTFTPQVIDLTQARAEQIISRNEGYGFGIRPFLYQDANYFRGDYIFWVQVERDGILRELPPRGEPTLRPGEPPRIDIDGIPPLGRPLAPRPRG